MKRGILSLVLGLVFCGTAFSQGKIQFNNDSLHLVYFTTDTTYLYPQDAGLAGQAVPAGGLLPSGGLLVVDLYAGLSSDNLSLMSTTGFGGPAQPGQWVPANVILPPGLPAGTPVYFQVRVHDVSFNGYAGNSVIFSGMPGTLGYPFLTSYWPTGTFPLDQLGVGYRGAIMLSLVPEPGTLALAALGVGAWLARRRGK